MSWMRQEGKDLAAGREGKGCIRKAGAARGRLSVVCTEAHGQAKMQLPTWHGWLCRTQFLNAMHAKSNSQKSSTQGDEMCASHLGGSGSGGG